MLSLKAVSRLRGRFSSLRRLPVALKRFSITAGLFFAVFTLLLSSVPPQAIAGSALTGLAVTSGSTTGGTDVPFNGVIEDAYVSIAASESHSLATTANGQVYSWGDNSSGQLGRTTGDEQLPRQVVALADKYVVSVSAAGFASFALTADGEVYSWGFNGYGQLGDGTTTDSSTPQLISTLSGKDVVSLSAGYAHVFALTASGEVYAWGANWEGQLGNGTTTNSLTPQLISALSGKDVISLSAGYYHSLALTASGEVYAWGTNLEGELGNGTTTNSSTPQLIPVLSGKDVVSLSAGYYHSLALTASGEIYTWGANWDGQLGNGTTTDSLTPQLISALSGKDIVSLSAGEGHSLALSVDGSVYAWGENYYGVLGDGTTVNSTTPVSVLINEEVISVAANGYHSLALTASGEVYAWGYNADGQLGDGTGRSITTPYKVDMLVDNATVVRFGAGGSHTFALTTNGDVYAWGANGSGQLGNGTTTNSSTPQLIPVLSGKDVVSLSAGNDHSLALTASGEVYAWGYNGVGQLGNGTTTNSSTPQLISALSGKDVISLNAGYYHSLALTASGEVYAWGYNRDGQLGDGTTINSSTPQLISALSGKDVISLSAGNYHSLALTASGEVYTWGANGDGQLGNGTTIRSTTPQLISVLSSEGIVSLNAGSNRSLALAANGEVYAWGNKGGEQLSNGTTTNSSTPRLISVLSGKDVISLITGYSHTFAVTASGDVYAWGYNFYGQLGNGTTTDSSTPQLIPALTDAGITSITAGGYHNIAITENGDIYTWGSNTSGNLGVGETEFRTTPVRTIAPNNIASSSLIPTVTFGGTPAQNVQIVTDGTGKKRLHATTPAHSAGTVDVVVKFPGQQEIVLPQAFTYTAVSTTPTPAPTPTPKPTSNSPSGGTVTSTTASPATQEVARSSSPSRLSLMTLMTSSAGSVSPLLARGSLAVTGPCAEIRTSLASLESSEALPLVADVQFYGGLSYSIGCASPGGSSTVTLSLAKDDSITESSLKNLRAYILSGGEMLDISDQVAFALRQDGSVYATYTLVDGGSRDKDGRKDGAISDQIYIGVLGASTSVVTTLDVNNEDVAPTEKTSYGWVIAAAATLFAVILAIILVKRRRQ